MGWLIVALLFLAVVFALFQALGMNGIRVHFGWLSFACVIAAMAFIPTLISVMG